MEQVLEALTNQNLSETLEVEHDSHDKLLEKYTIEPLMPNISNKNSVLSANNSNENIKKEELLTRLTYTLKKLNRYERDLDKNLDMDPSHPNAKDSFTQIKEALPENMEETITGVMQSTQEYIEKLNDQLEDLDKADQQVNAFSSNFTALLRLLTKTALYIHDIYINTWKLFCQVENSMMKTLRDIDVAFQSLLNDLSHEINKRREQLILETEIYKYESLIPLRACRREVEAQMRNAQNIISISEDMLEHSRYNANEFAKIMSASNDIGR